MSARRRRVGRWLAGWAAAWAFWLVATRGFHPTWFLALVVTTALVGAYALAASWNEVVLRPELRRTGRWGRYAPRLGAVMLGLTALALGVIRAAYLTSLGPDPDPYGAIRHYAIDLFGMAVHVGAAAGVTTALRRWGR
jgi:hypothetical protein